MSHVYALGELEAFCKKAAHGAGMAWGVAEEAGKAVKFLSAHDFGAAELLAQILPMQKAIAKIAVKDGVVEPLGDAACPIVAGVALADRMGDSGAQGGDEWQVGRIYAPLLSLPILWRAADFHGKILHWQSDGLQAYLGACGFAVSGDTDKTESASADIATVSAMPNDFPTPLKPTRQDGIIVNANSYAVLHKFFMETTVPQTEASRLHGAGAGLSDND